MFKTFQKEIAKIKFDKVIVQKEEKKPEDTD